MRRLVRAVVLAGLVTLGALAQPATAAIQPSAGLEPGFHVGLGLSGLAADLAVGPVAIGLAAALPGGWRGGMMGGGMMGGAGGAGQPLELSARAVFTARRTDALAVGIVIGGTNLAGTSGPTATPWSGWPAWGPPAARGLVGDVGLAASFRLPLPLMGPMIGMRREQPFVLVLSPVMTLMLDGAYNVALGPHTGIELAAELTPEAAITIGGGTLVGLRLHI